MFIATSLDLRGASCAAVVERTAAALDVLPRGSLVEVTADDPASETDLMRWAKANGNDLLECSHLGPVFRFVIRHH